MPPSPSTTPPRTMVARPPPTRSDFALGHGLQRPLRQDGVLRGIGKPCEEARHHRPSFAAISPGTNRWCPAASATPTPMSCFTPTSPRTSPPARSSTSTPGPPARITLRLTPRLLPRGTAMSTSSCVDGKNAPPTALVPGRRRSSSSSPDHRATDWSPPRPALDPALPLAGPASPTCLGSTPCALGGTRRGGTGMGETRQETSSLENP